MELDEYLEVLGLVVRQRRESLNLRQAHFEDFGKDSIPSRSVRAIEAGQYNITVKTLIRLSSHLRWTPAQLLRETEKALGK